MTLSLLFTASLSRTDRATPRSAFKRYESYHVTIWSIIVHRSIIVDIQSLKQNRQFETRRHYMDNFFDPEYPIHSILFTDLCQNLNETLHELYVSLLHRAQLCPKLFE